MISARDGSRMAETAIGGLGSRQPGPQGAPPIALGNNNALDLIERRNQLLAYHVIIVVLEPPRRFAGFLAPWMSNTGFKPKRVKRFQCWDSDRKRCREVRII